MRTYIHTLAITLALFLAGNRTVAACTCVAAGDTAWPTLERAAGITDTVVIGRVVARTTLAVPRPYEGNDVAYVDLEVIDGVKGVSSGARLRVWDAGFGSDCSVDLRPLEATTLVAMAVNRNRAEYREYQQVMQLSVGATDFLLGSCGEYMRQLKSDAEGSYLAEHLRKAARAAQNGRRTTR